MLFVSDYDTLEIIIGYCDDLIIRNLYRTCTYMTKTIQSFKLHGIYRYERTNDMFVALVQNIDMVLCKRNIRCATEYKGKNMYIGYKYVFHDEIEIMCALNNVFISTKYITFPELELEPLTRLTTAHEIHTSYLGSHISYDNSISAYEQNTRHYSSKYNLAIINHKTRSVITYNYKPSDSSSYGISKLSLLMILKPTPRVFYTINIQRYDLHSIVGFIKTNQLESSIVEIEANICLDAGEDQIFDFTDYTALKTITITNNNCKNSTLILNDTLHDLTYEAIENDTVYNIPHIPRFITHITIFDNYDSFFDLILYERHETNIDITITEDCISGYNTSFLSYEKTETIKIMINLSPLDNIDSLIHLNQYLFWLEPVVCIQYLMGDNLMNVLVALETKQCMTLLHNIISHMEPQDRIEMKSYGTSVLTMMQYMRTI